MKTAGPNPEALAIVGQLKDQIEQLHLAGRPAGRPPISSGLPALDRLLPGGGFSPSSLVEWIAAAPGSGAGILAMHTARQACKDGRVLVIVDREGSFYPPAAIALGLDPRQLILVRPENESDTHWAIDQALRCCQVAAVWSSIERLSARTFRRWQLAAEAGGGLGLLIRPSRACREPSWADVRLLVQAAVPPAATPADETDPLGTPGREKKAESPGDADVSWTLSLEVLRRRGAAAHRRIEIELAG